MFYIFWIWNAVSLRIQYECRKIPTRKNSVFGQFSRSVLKRWYFRKTCTGIWSFLHYQERWFFFFFKIWCYCLDRKWKMIFLKKRKKKKNMNFCKGSKKIVFQNNGAGIWSFLYHQRNMMFSFPKNMILFFRWKMKDDLSQKKYMETGYFLQVLWEMIFTKNSL